MGVKVIKTETEAKDLTKPAIKLMDSDNYAKISGKDEVGKIFIVTKIGPESTLGDIFFGTTVGGLILQAKGGLTAEEIIFVSTDEIKAKEFAMKEMEKVIKTKTK